MFRNKKWMEAGQLWSRNDGLIPSESLTYTTFPILGFATFHNFHVHKTISANGKAWWFVAWCFGIRIWVSQKSQPLGPKIFQTHLAGLQPQHQFATERVRFFPFSKSQNLDGMHWRYIFQWLNTEKCEGKLGKSKWSCWANHPKPYPTHRTLANFHFHRTAISTIFLFSRQHLVAWSSNISRCEVENVVAGELVKTT